MKLFVIFIALACATQSGRADDPRPKTSFDELLQIFDKVFSQIMEIIGTITGTVIPFKDQKAETAKALDFLRSVKAFEKYRSDVENCDNDDNEAACAIVARTENTPAFHDNLAETLQAYQDEYETIVGFAYRSAAWFSYKNNISDEVFDVLIKIMDEAERIMDIMGTMDATMKSEMDSQITKESSSEESGSSEEGFPEQYYKR